MVGNTFFFNWEITLIEWIQAHQGRFGELLASAASLLGNQLVPVLLLGFIYWCYDKELGKSVGTNLLIGIVCFPLIKNIFSRRRPYFDNPNIRCLNPAESGADPYDISAQGYSFPSGHASCAVCTYGGIAAYKKSRLTVILAVVLPILIGFSRFASGVHYPTDVLAGWLIGAVIVWLTGFLQKHIKRQWIIYLAFILAGLPGWFYCRSEDYFTAYGLMVGVFTAFVFEERYVGFKITKDPLRRILRLSGGGALALILNTVLKLPFAAEVLEADNFAAHLIRFLRYLITGFVVIGLYPMLFKIVDRTVDRRNKQ